MTEVGGIDSERINLSQRLTILADRFTIEATLWHRAEQHAACISTARELDSMARRVLGSVDLDTAEGFHDAAELLYRQVEGTRRLFTAYLSLATKHEERNSHGRNGSEGN